MNQSLTAASTIDLADKTGVIIERASGAVCVCCYAAMTLVALLGVFFRYVMNSPFMWTEEVARYLMVWLGFTAINIAFRQSRHIKVEVASQFLPAMLSRIISYLVDGLIILFFIVLLKQGTLMVLNNIMSASTLPLSMSWILAALPVAAVLTLAQILLRIIKKVSSDLSGVPIKKT